MNVNPFISLMMECDKVFECLLCGKSFKLNFHLKRHLNICKAQEIDWVTCDKCGARLISKKTLRVHKAKCDSSKMYNCMDCNEKFSSYTKLVEHRESDHISVPCEFCEYVGHPKNIKRHLKTVHKGLTPAAEARLRKTKKDSKFKCPQCGKVFCDKSTLNRHIKKHCKFPKHVNDESVDNFEDENIHILDNLMDTVNFSISDFPGLVPDTLVEIDISKIIEVFEGEPSDKPITHNLKQAKINKCKVCGKMYSRDKHLDEHMLSAHNSIQLLNKNSLSNVADLTTQTNPKRNLIQQILQKCNKCGRIFYKSEVFLKHMENMHGIQIDTINMKRKGNSNVETIHEIKCEICGKPYKKEGWLKTHMVLIHGV